MKYYDIPHFVIKNDLQKSAQTGVYFSDGVTVDVLRDVCLRITGQTTFTYDYVDKDYEDEFLAPTYNKGRMAILKYQNQAIYISFSEQEIGGRNSSVQSLSTAFNLYFTNPYPFKQLYYYFLGFKGNAETDYHILIYRLMETIGFKFLNADSVLTHKILPFSSIDDIISLRRINAGKNRSNNSTFITKSSFNNIEIYGKTYGASKYETSMFCYALSILAQGEQQILLYEIMEQDLTELPSPSLNVIRSMGKIKIIPTDMQMEKKVYRETNSLRSPRYLYNLFNKLGNKKCALCGCEIPELIQGAHIWTVASIKKDFLLPLDKKLDCAIDRDNGLWLCENHHKLFDENILRIASNGEIKVNSSIGKENIEYINKITSIKELPSYVMTDKFIEYLDRRNRELSAL